jgi:uncharacterized protein YfiM (DUF2279 family)
MLRTELLAVVFSCISVLASGQHDSSTVDRKKLRTLVVAAGVGYTAGLATLNHVWYKDTERQSFRFFNDNAEWKQVDKVGHFFASFHLSRLASGALRSCNVEERKSDLYGALSGFLLTVPIEVFDAYSDGYGASVGDVVADAAGPVFFAGQKMLWNEVRLYPKFSFHQTDYAPLRPSLLGDSPLSEIVKDYNGQTYWLSVDMDKFISFPRWVNIAVGYGANDMIYARDGQNRAAGFDPYRQYYLAIDFDLTSIRTRSKFVKTLIDVVSTVRLPGPAVEFSSRGSKFRPFYF